MALAVVPPVVAMPVVVVVGVATQRAMGQRQGTSPMRAGVAPHRSVGAVQLATALTAMPNPRARTPIWAPTVATVCPLAGVLAPRASLTRCVPVSIAC